VPHGAANTTIRMRGIDKMSASSKKKLRKEMAADLLTEKQKKAQKEAKQLKAQTISFVAIMLIIAILATSVLVYRGINTSGIIDRKTVAAIIDGQELNSVQMNYYLTDYITNMYAEMEAQFGTSTTLYFGMMGLNANAPLDEQKYTSSDEFATWGDFYLAQALKKAVSDYALYNKAMSEGFKLTEDEQKALETNISYMDIYASISGYKNADKYLQARYGYGSTVESYAKYAEISTIASAYANKYSADLTYDDAAIRAYEKDKENNYTSISYNFYSVDSNSYLEGGTENAEGVKEYSDAEKAAALKKAEEIAKELAKSTDLAALDKAIAALEINKDKTVSSTALSDQLYPQITTEFQSWLIDKARVKDEITVIDKQSTSTDADGKEIKTTTGYYVVCFQSRNENLRPLANVRHLLVQFEGGTTGTDGVKTYSDAEKATAKAEAERLLQLWKDGEATEDSFIALVKEHSDDGGSKDDGGMIEDIHPQSALVENFLNWSIDAERKVGDTAVIVSEYGYHVMFYSSDDELTYRDYMIREDIRAEDFEKWYNGIVDASTGKTVKTNRLNTGIILANLSSKSS